MSLKVKVYILKEGNFVRAAFASIQKRTSSKKNELFSLAANSIILDQIPDRNGIGLYESKEEVPYEKWQNLCQVCPVPLKCFRLNEVHLLLRRQLTYAHRTTCSSSIIRIFTILYMYDMPFGLLRDFKLWLCQLYIIIKGSSSSSRKHAYIIMTPLNPTFIQ